jgi:hypothetical protein
MIKSELFIFEVKDIIVEGKDGMMIVSCYDSINFKYDINGSAWDISKIC